jgi:hypothetical protein
MATVPRANHGGMDYSVTQCTCRLGIAQLVYRTPVRCLTSEAVIGVKVGPTLVAAVLRPGLPLPRIRIGMQIKAACKLDEDPTPD